MTRRRHLCVRLGEQQGSGLRRGHELHHDIHGDAQELSKWQHEYVLSNPDVYKARRRVYSLEPEWRFALPMAVDFDPVKSRLLVVDPQRWRIQIYNKLHNYDDPQFNI